jgi:hypothetical protein
MAVVRVLLYHGQLSKILDESLLTLASLVAHALSLRHLFGHFGHNLAKCTV